MDINIETMKPWDRQKNLQEKGIVLTPKEVMELASTAPKDYEKILIILTYLTAGRVNEVVNLQKDDFQFVEKGGRDFLLIHIKNLKHKKRHYKEIPIPLDKEIDFIRPLVEYLNAIKGPGLFPFKTARTARNIFARYGYNPHWFRHIRVTHLVTVYDLNESLVQRFAGWTDTRPARHYMELKWSDISQKM